MFPKWLYLKPNRFGDTLEYVPDQCHISLIQPQCEIGKEKTVHVHGHSSTKAYELCSLRLFESKTDEQTIQTENLSEKLQNWNQTFR